MDFKEKVREEKLGLTPQFWIMYMDKVWDILTYLRATKVNNLDLQLYCMERICPLFFSMDHHNYARYLSIQLISMLNMDRSHPGAKDLLEKGALSVARSSVPASRTPVDVTIEQTINRHAKSSGGIIGFSRNYPAYYRWCVTRHSRAAYVTATLDMAGMDTMEESCHKSTRPSQMKRSEKDVQSVKIAFNNFMNPFECEIQQSLFCLSSGVSAPSDIQDDLLKVNEDGTSRFKDFIHTRLVEKSVPFHAPLKKRKLKTFAAMQVKKKVMSSQNKVIEIRAERNLYGQLPMYAEEHNISMEKALKFPLGPLPWALATSDGFPTKTDKSTLLHKLEDKSAVTVVGPAPEAIHIVDGNAVIHSMTSLPDNFAQLAAKVFFMLPQAQRVDFVTDTYKDQSIKFAEHDRRGTSEPFLIKGPSTKVPKDWKSFLQNSKNKEQLLRLLLAEWQKDEYAAKLHGRELMFVCGEECIALTSNDGREVKGRVIQELASSQEEADTRIILHCCLASNAEKDIRLFTRHRCLYLVAVLLQ